MNTTVYQKAIYIRAFESLLLSLFSEGKLNGTVHTCVGQEMIPAILSEHIRTNDTFFSNHRGHGHYLAKTKDYRGLLAEVMGKVTGCSKGYGGSQHLHHQGFYSNGIQGGFAPVAVGFALANAIQKTEENNISVLFIGDGTLGEGTLYEAINLAAIYNAPILFVLENNKYAQSTSIKQTLRGNLKSRIEGFGVDYFNASIYDLDNLNNEFEYAVANTRNNKASFIEIECYRLNSHSKGDDNRDIKEIEHYKSIDPINVFKKNDELAYSNLENEANLYLKKLLAEIEKDETLLNSIQNNLIVENSISYSTLEIPTLNCRINENIYTSFKQNLKDDKSIIILGEDIENNNSFNPEQYGGAFKVTKDLSNLFPENVKNTPISEAGITGLGIGLALGGMKPIVEIMFGDFTTLVVDQILQQASKIQGMYGFKIDLPFVLRTPMGGKRGYGPTHSQSLEKFFLGIPYVNLLALNKRIHPKDIYDTIFQTNKDATIVIESKMDYVRFLDEKFIETHDYFVSNEKYPTLKITPKNMIPKFTIFCYGGCLSDCEEAVFDLYIESEIMVEIICPIRIQPLNIYPIAESIKVSKNLLLVEEGFNFASLGSEVVTKLFEKNILIKNLKRIGNNSIIPSSLKAELNLLQNKNSIKNEILKVYED